uniref:Dynein cytoplasmic 1 intermediate chain 1 n=1 Tax=Xiphophorus couchianus TaxID=32473 RepID=A0A3B5KRS7_9TELE
MSDKSDLKAELERKKQRLAQIREEKKRKEEERKKKESDSQQKTEVTPEDSDLDRKRRETEALLQSIGISPEPPLEQKGFHSVVFRLDLKDQKSAVSRPSPPRSSLVLS